jgi:hypothetical protein
MYRAFLGIVMAAGALAPLRAEADVVTTNIGGRDVTYVVTAAPRGIGLSKKEIIDQISRSEPVAPIFQGSPSPEQR